MTLTGMILMALVNYLSSPSFLLLVTLCIIYKMANK